MLGYLERAPRALLAGALIVIIAAIDWLVQANIAFGFLYLLPMLLVGAVLPLWGIVLTALICTVLADVFDPFVFTLSVGLPQDILVFTALAGTGLYSREITRNRQQERTHLQTVEREAGARRIVEEQLEFLIENSPAAILIMDSDHLILRANPSAHRLFGAPAGELTGKCIRRYLPALGRVDLSGTNLQTYRTEMQCRGVREPGEVFLANVFFSTYGTALGPRLAALVLDASDELRAREELGMEQLLSASRILVGAVSQEVRMGGGAIGRQEPELVDMVPRGRLGAQAVGGDLVSGARQSDHPNRVLLAVTDDGDDRHGRKIRRLSGYDRSEQQGERQGGEDGCCPTPEEHAVP